METLLWLVFIFIVVPGFVALYVHNGMNDADDVTDDYPWWDNEDWGDKS